jgi:poly-gamma-glutamate synthesis protein (capsule biosynthesis protein)
VIERKGTPSRIRFPVDSENKSKWSLFAAGDFNYEGDVDSELPVAEGLRKQVTNADVSIANVEAPMPVDAEPIAKVGPTLQSGLAAPEVLRRIGFDSVALANNHMMDYGPAGLTETKQAYDDAGFSTCGADIDLDSAIEPARMRIDDVSLAVFSLCEREFGVAQYGRPGTAWISHPEAQRRVSKVADSTDVVVVMAHGGIEYVPFSPPQRQTQLREFVDAGADIVIGHHPHVPQGWEVYRDSPIFYSLGNFLFEIPDRPKTKWGLTLKCVFTGSAPQTVELLPVEMVNGIVREMRHQHDLASHLDYLRRLSEITESRAELRAHWQEISSRMFPRRHVGSIRRFVVNDTLSLARNPVRRFRGEIPWYVGHDRKEILGLLNIVRNESHRALLQTALAVEAGDIEDERSRDVRRQTQQLLEWTEREPSSIQSNLVEYIRTKLRTIFNPK